MRYTHRYNPKVMAHRIGDNIPDWVMDLVTARQLILRTPENPQNDTDVIFELPSLITSDVVDVPLKGGVGDYLVFDGVEYKIVPGDEFEMMYDAEEKAPQEDREFVNKDAPVLLGVGVITKDEMEKLLDEKVKGAVLIGNQFNRGMFFPAIIAIDYKNGRVIYDRDTLVDQVFKHSGGGTWEDADEHVSYNIERALEAMTNDENRNHMPLIVEKQECY